MKSKTFSPLKIKQLRLTAEQDEILQRKRDARARELGIPYLSQENFIRWCVLNAPVAMEPLPATGTAIEARSEVAA